MVQENEKLVDNYLETGGNAQLSAHDIVEDYNIDKRDENNELYLKFLKFKKQKGDDNQNAQQPAKKKKSVISKKFSKEAVYSSSRKSFEIVGGPQVFKKEF